MVELANTIWADGPAGAPLNPAKYQMRAWGTYVEGAITAFTSNGGLIYDTKTSLDADLAHGANSSAWVIGDAAVANNGIYRKLLGSGLGSWERVADLPYSFIKATDSGSGSADVIVATTSIPVPAADGAALIALNIFETNTASPVTVSFNAGSALTVKTNSGNNVAVGGLVAGAIVLGYVSGSTFRLVSDQASAAIVADAEAVLEEIRDRYLGTFADDAAATAGAVTPIEGQLYFRTSDDMLRVYRGGVWVSAEGEQGIQGDQGIQGIQGERDTRNFCWAGSFDHARRGPSIAGTAGRVGTLDGWTIGRSGGVTGVTVSQQQGSRGTNLCMQVQRTAADANTGSIGAVFNLGLDDTRPLAGKAAIKTYRARCMVRSATVAISQASPGVVTWASHGLTVDKPLHFTTTGALPTGLLPSTNYYVKTVLDANTFTVSATIGGAAINTTSAGSGVHTINASDYSGAAGALNVAVKASSSLIEQAINLTNGNYSVSDSTATSAVITINSLWQTFTMPTWAYAADVAQTALRFQQVPTGVAGAADGFQIEEVQLQLGTVATTFVPVDPAYSLMKAEQQYRKSYGPDTTPGSVTYNGRLASVAVGTAIGKGALMNADFGGNSMRAIPTVVLYSPQTGAAGKMAQGSTADIDATAVHLGRGGFGIWNNALAVAGEVYYVHYTAEARL
jgi:hypothetical protein